MKPKRILYEMSTLSKLTVRFIKQGTTHDGYCSDAEEFRFFREEHVIERFRENGGKWEGKKHVPLHYNVHCVHSVHSVPLDSPILKDFGDWPEVKMCDRGSGYCGCPEMLDIVILDAFVSR